MVDLPDLAGSVDRCRNDPEAGYGDHGGQDVVLDGVDLAVPIDLDHLLGVGQLPMIPKMWCRMPNGHIQLHQTRPSIIVMAMITGPDQVAGDRLGRQRRGDGHQRRGFQEQRHRPPLEVTQVGDEQKEEKEPQEQALVSTSNLNHRSLRRGDWAWSWCLAGCALRRDQSSALARSRERGSSKPGRGRSGKIGLPSRYQYSGRLDLYGKPSCPPEAVDDP